MKHLLFIVIFLLSLTSQAQQKELYCSKYKHLTTGERLEIDDFRSDSVDILNTSIWLDMRDMGSQFIQARTSINFESRVDGLDEIRLDLEGLTVDSVTGNLVSSFDHSDASLKVLTSGPLDKGESTEITIYYHGNPIKDASGWGGFYYQGGYAWNLGVGFDSDPHSYGRIWFPCFDNFIERSSFDFEVITPENRRASCNGQLISLDSNQDGSITSKWKLDEHIPSYLVCVAVSEYVSLEDEFVGSQSTVPIQLFCKASDTTRLKSSFIHLNDALEAFEASYGPYRFGKVGYSLVPFNAGAMEHATNITYPIYAANGTLANESLMSHELAHMWWGDNTTCETDGDMWLNEGWASFSEYLFDEHVYGREAYEEHMLEDLRYMLQYGHHFEEGYRAVSGQPHEYVYGDHVYKKGALVAHNLRGYLGDDAFFDGVSAFMDAYTMSPVSSDSLERFLSNHTGTDLDEFFRDWVFTGGWNVVVMDSFQTTPNDGQYEIEVFVQQKLKGRETFHDDCPVHVKVYDSSGNSESFVGRMSGKYATLSFTSSFEPAWITIGEDNEMARARTADIVEVTEEGSLNLDNMYWNIEVSNVNEATTVYFEQIWSYPDPIKDYNNKPFKLNDNRYWRISGLNMEDVELGEAFFFYDGRSSGGSGYLDISLLQQTEDSLILLYRSSPADDWNEYEHYTKNVLGLSDNAIGLMELDQVLPGEYVLANLDQTVLSNKLLEDEEGYVSVFPNPATSNLNIQNHSNELIQFRLFNIEGKRVLSDSLNPGITTLDIGGQAPGVYMYECWTLDGQELTESGKVVID